MFPSDPHNEAVHGGGGNRTRELCPDKPSTKAEFVYFIQAGGDDGPIKIGKAKDIGKRLATIQTHCPYDVEVIGYETTEDALGLESDLHGIFSADRIRGEWFRPSRQIMDYISEATIRVTDEAVARSHAVTCQR